MSKRTEAIQQAAALSPLGFTAGEIDTLTCLANTLHRWDESECNGDIETDDDGTAYRVYGQYGAGAITRVKIRNREASAWRRVQAVVGEKGYTAERQGDPRGVPFCIVAGTKRIAVLWI